MDRKNPSRVGRIAAGLALVIVAVAGSLVPAEADPGNEKTWVGRVEKHGRHYDYDGPPCPLEDTDPCPSYTVKYEIVPTSAQAARALPKVAGHRARLIGYRELVRKPGHNGTLMISEVRSKRAPEDPITGE